MVTCLPVLYASYTDSGQIEIPVDDNERHADGDHAKPRRVTQDREQGAGIGEEVRIDNDTSEVNQRHEDEQAEFPALHQAGQASVTPAARCQRHRGVAIGASPPIVQTNASTHGPVTRK